MRRVFLCLALIAACLSGCSTSGTLGLVTKSMADPGALLKDGRGYKELGPTSGEACRFFVLAIIPFGDSAFSSAVDDALRKAGGDALLNVTTTSSLYGFIPIYNVYTYTCTEVRGIAIKMNEK